MISLAADRYVYDAHPGVGAVRGRRVLTAARSSAVRAALASVTPMVTCRPLLSREAQRVAHAVHRARPDRGL